VVSVKPRPRPSAWAAAAWGAWTLALATAATQAAPPDTGTATYIDIHRTARAEAVVEAVRQSTLAAQVSGRVVAVAVRAGDAVKSGQLLIQIDARTATQAEAASQGQLREAQANLVNAAAKHERSRQLVERKFISQAALDQAAAEYAAAQAQTATAMANASASSTSKSFTAIVAPYDGVVASTDAEVGDLATAGRPLVTVFDPRALRVAATLPQSLLTRADISAPVDVEIPSVGRTVVAQRVTVLPVADVRTHTTQVRLDLPPTPGLLPGQYARVAIVTGHERVLAIPAAAVLRRGEVTAVYVVDIDGRAQLRQVRLGEPAGSERVEVLAGLDAGEAVSIAPVRTGIESSRNPAVAARGVQFASERAQARR